MRAGTVYLIDSVMKCDESRITIVCVCVFLSADDLSEEKERAQQPRERAESIKFQRKRKKKRKKINKYVNRLFLDCVRPPLMSCFQCKVASAVDDVAP